MDLLIGMLLVSIIIFSPYYYYYYYYYPCSHLHARYNDNYIIESNCVSRVYSVAAILYLQFVLHVMLFRPWNMFCTFTLALSVVFVQCPIWLFFLYFLNFVLSRYVAQVLSEWFLKWFQLPVLLPVSLCFHIPHPLNFYCEVFIF